MVRTRVGFSGGTEENPTYHSLGDHTETVEIDYDPSQISYEQLLALFWKSHSPGVAPWSRQYQAAIFYHNAEQKRLALESKAKVVARIKGEVYTQILPATKFYLAEDYHQKYFLRQQPELFKELSAIYPTTAELIASTAAARLNGYAAGYGTREGLLGEINRLGLSLKGKRRLLASVPASGSPPALGCPVRH